LSKLEVNIVEKNLVDRIEILVLTKNGNSASAVIDGSDLKARYNYLEKFKDKLGDTVDVVNFIVNIATKVPR
jgi:hypothetical protein